MIDDANDDEDTLIFPKSSALARYLPLTLRSTALISLLSAPRGHIPINNNNNNNNDNDDDNLEQASQVHKYELPRLRLVDQDQDGR